MDRTKTKNWKPPKYQKLKNKNNARLRHWHVWKNNWKITDEGNALGSRSFRSHCFAMVWGRNLLTQVTKRVLGETVWLVHSGSTSDLNAWFRRLKCLPAGLFTPYPLHHRPASKRSTSSSGWWNEVSWSIPSSSIASRLLWREGPSDRFELDGTLSTQL